jgi:hypothetical protein
LYAFAALEAFSATALNSLPVQALAVDMSEIVPAPAVASNAAMTDSESSPSVTIRKHQFGQRAISLRTAGRTQDVAAYVNISEAAMHDLRGHAFIGTQNFNGEFHLAGPLLGSLTRASGLALKVVEFSFA